MSLGSVTEELINKSPFLREAMTDDLINISALARKLKPEIEAVIGKEVQEGAIIMSIKRMSPGLYHRLNIKITNLMSDLGDFLVRSNLCEVTVENNDSLKKCQSEIIDYINSSKDSFFCLNKGVSETSFVTTSMHFEYLLDKLETENIKSHASDLASVTIKLPASNSETYGVYYYILKQLAWEGINVVQIVSTALEFTLVVNQKDINHTFSLLLALRNN